VSFGPTCIVTVTQNLKRANTHKYHLELWNLLGVSLGSIPVHEQIRSISVNSEVVFLLLVRRVICIAASTGSRLDDMEINRSATGEFHLSNDLEF
jgi:hypothetical protein